MFDPLRAVIPRHPDPTSSRKLILFLFTLPAVLWTASLQAGMFYVSTTGSDGNTGAVDSPWMTIQKGLDEAMAGDTLNIADGVYNESLDTIRDGALGNRITIRAENSGQATVTNSGRVLDFDHSHITFDGIRFDGQFGTSDIIRVRTGADFGTLTGVEVLNGSRDGIDLGTNRTSSAPTDFLEGFTIADATVHDTLWIDSNGDRQDAHGIVAGGVRDFTLSDTEVFFVSGDAFQLQDGDWDNVLVDSVKFWNGPLPEATNGFAAGVNPGENAIDTKQDDNLPTRGRLTIRDSVFFGWNGELIPLASALVLKEQVDVTIERSLFYDNLIALRLRGETDNNAGAFVTLKNSVLYNNDRAARFENNLANLNLWNNTFGDGHRIFFEDGGAGGVDELTLMILNNLFLGSKPDEAAHFSNLSASPSDFVNSAAHNYRLAPGSAAIDAGIILDGVMDDFDMQSRPIGVAYDSGAFEFLDETSPIPPANEPTSLMLCVSAALALVAFRRNRRHAPMAVSP